jgi:Protein of unknown function (DUF732)
MEALARANRWILQFRYQPLPIRLLAVAAAFLTAASAFAAPSEANSIDDQFVAALNKAGVNFGDQGNAVALGQSVCPMLAKPGGNFAAAVAKVKGGGISPQMADMFTQIAIQMYCPSAIADIASGNFGGLPKVPGLPGI